QNGGETDVSLGGIGIKTQRRGKFLDRLIGPTSFLQSGGVIDMRSRTIRKISDDHDEAFELVPRDVHLPVPECSKRNDKNSRPFRRARPNSEETLSSRYQPCRHRFREIVEWIFPYFPNEPIVIKMQERGGGHDAGKHAFDSLDPDTRFEIAERPVGED